MNWKFSRRIWLFLTASFSFGMGQAFTMLFLNFYLRALGLDGGMQGLINALPAFVSAVIAIPAVLVARRLREVLTLKLGSLLAVAGMLVLALSNGAAMALAGSFIQGVGSALVMVSSSPFMAAETTEENRVPLFSLQMALMTGAGFLGNLLGGQIPTLYARYAGVPADSLAAVRAAILVAVVFQLVGTLPIFLIQNQPNQPAASLNRLDAFKVEDKVLMAKLIIPNVLVGLGAGATIPYLNLFIEAKFRIDYGQLGSLFGWTSLATAATVLIQPWIVRKLGQIKAVVAVQSASLPFLVMLGYSPAFFLVVLSLFTRGALMNAAGPVFSAFAMSKLPQGDRPMFSALNAMSWNIGWALAATFSGVFRSFFGPAGLLTAFGWLFAWTILMYAMSMVLTYVWLVPKKPRRA
ncbi:MFS transporter [Proteiniclasticum sp. QWL-01]|uniref:MFS transporter n=1 Tax=Proteiniclasticum sp. QWL-01 TaxID=3036945 RepID=UPI00240FF669|nr:MFS transporter [Proteiniclasticum sp. QWL-01]WFF72513.1 MFS transporter [Proteiniclasticum sp. QWL-01]